MSKKVLLTKKNLVVTYDDVRNYLHLEWIGFQRIEEDIMAGGNEIVKILKSLPQCSNILNDNTKVSGAWSKGADWTKEVWFPAMISAGMKKFAWVFPSNIFAEISAKKSMPDNDLVTKFSTIADAERWLKA